MDEAFDGALADLSLTNASRLVRERRVSSVELTEACLHRIAERNPELNAFITVTEESARMEARTAEREIQSGAWRGPLHGIPIALKDLVDMAGIPTTAGSNFFRNRIPEVDADVVQGLKAAGAVFLGKLNLHEFAFGASSVVSAFGPVRNPCNLEYSAGGSSSGSAAAVAAGLCYAAVGTDTGGSIRQPAAFCGVVGLKPTYGWISARGVVPLSKSLDHVGPMARTVADAALLLQAMAPHPMASNNAHELSALRIGVPRAHFYDGLHPDIEAATEAALLVLQTLTHSQTEIYLEMHHDLGNLLTKAEAFAYHRQHVEATPDLYQAETLRRIRSGASVEKQDYEAAVIELEALRHSALSVFQNVDLVVTPTTAVPPFRIADLAGSATLREKEQLTLRNTRPFNVLGWPAISVPCGRTREGLPIGLQIAGAPGAEAMVVALAAAYERAAT